jgi:hypothetical protein
MTALTTIAAALAATTLATALALAQALPYPKTGTCAPGYRESGGFCAPSRDAVAAIPKQPSKQCPSGWSSSAHACVEMRRP